MNENESRALTLLKAALEILQKSDEGPFVKSALELTAHYDGADCDGRCLREDIEHFLEYEAAALRERDMVRVTQSFLRQLPQPEGRFFLSEYDANAEGITQYWAYERGCAHALAMVAERVNTVLPASPTLTEEGGE